MVKLDLLEFIAMEHVEVMSELWAQREFHGRPVR